jgi:hypothetical protein
MPRPTVLTILQPPPAQPRGRSPSRLLESTVAVECRAPLSVRLDRARRRGFNTGAASDADAGVVRRQEDDGELAEDVPPGQHVVLRTDRPAEDALDDLAALLDARLGRPRP